MGKILFIRGGAIGDFILTMPAMQLVRENLPGTRVEVLGYQSITRLAKAAKLVDASRSIEHGPMAGFFVPDGQLDKNLMDYFASFSVVVSYLYDSDGFFRANVERCKAGTFLQAPHRIDENKRGESAARQLAKPLESLALFLETPYVDFPAAFGDSLDPVASPQAKPCIALHPGSGSPRKNWSLEGWIAVVEQVQQKFPLAEWLIVSGEAEERSIADFLALLKTTKARWRHLEHVELPTLAATMQNCDLFLGHDSGISHLAAACNTPAVLLFGPTNPKIWAPQNPGVRIIQAINGDLSKITVDEVSAAAMDHLSK